MDGSDCRQKTKKLIYFYEIKIIFSVLNEIIKNNELCSQPGISGITEVSVCGIKLKDIIRR